MKKPLPIGVDNFEDLILNNYFYVDKTLLVRELLDKKGKVSLFTRPRRFGKTLNLSMLRYFFEDTGNPEQNAKNRKLFSYMKIMEAGNYYIEKMGQFPIINLTLKSAKQVNFEDAYYQLREAVMEEFDRHAGQVFSLCAVQELNEAQKEKYEQLRLGTAEKSAYCTAIKFLSACLYKTTGKKTIILIDEYDVPLENAYFRGFYQEMTDFIRSLFESALKTNEALEFAVITGCLRISRESIFTGLNHLNVISILDKSYSEYFGFTADEVMQLAGYYGHAERMNCIREWYDGYDFGEREIYNPWSVIKFMADLNADAAAVPVPYWANTSSNTIVRCLVEKAGMNEKTQIETLLAGGEIEVPVCEEITYEDMEQKGEGLWNFLYFTGYLTKRGERLDSQTKRRLVRLGIPNGEIKLVYENTILSWFHEQLEKRDFHALYKAMEQKDTQIMQDILNEQLMSTISFYDYAENFYHGFLTGIFGQNNQYIVKSNRESGEGRSDLMIYSPNLEKQAFVLELKSADSFERMEERAKQALEQIYQKKYDSELKSIGYRDIVSYGIAFYRKNCRVVCGEGK